MKFFEFLGKLFLAWAALDVRIFERIEKFCHMTQRTFGWTNFTWMKLVFGLLGFAVGIVPIFFKNDLKSDPAIPSAEDLWIVTGFLTIFFGWFGFLATTLMEKQSSERLAKRLANPLKEIFIICTLVRVLYVVIIGVGGPPIYLMTLMAFIITYLVQCDPLPPCDSKLKQWFESLFLTPIPLRSGDR